MECTREAVDGVIERNTSVFKELNIWLELSHSVVNDPAIRFIITNTDVGALRKEIA